MVARTMWIIKATIYFDLVGRKANKTIYLDMTLKDFQALGINAKANAVWDGTFLDTVADTKYNIHLYNVATFYVKVYYSNKLNEIVKIRAFKSTSLIQPYLDAIGDDFLESY